MNKDSKNKDSKNKDSRRKKVVIDPEYEWESLQRKTIQMNKRNVNQNIAGKHRDAHKHEVSPSGKAMLLFMLGMIGSVAFILICTYMGVKVKKINSRVNETLITTEAYESKETEPASERETDSQSEETLIAESMAPGRNIEDLDVIGGNGELVGFSFPSQYHKEWILIEKEFRKALEAAGYDTDFRYAEKNSLSETTVAADKSSTVADTNSGHADENPSGTGAANPAGISSENKSQKSISIDEIVKQQIADIRELQEAGAKVIFVGPADAASEELGKVLNDVRNSGIYVVALDHVPMHTNGVNYLFGCDDYHVGEAIGWHIVDELDLINASASEPKCIEIFTGDFTDETLYYLYPGLMDILFPYIDSGALVVGSGQFELEQVSVMDNSRQEAESRMQSLLSAVYDKRELDAVICTNDVLAGGVSDAIAGALRDGTYKGSMPIITGDGCDDSALDRILQGRQSMSVFHDPLQYAYRGTELVDQILHGEEPGITDSEMYQNGNIVVPVVELTPVIVTKENYQDVIVNRGYMQTAVLVD